MIECQKPHHFTHTKAHESCDGRGWFAIRGTDGDSVDCGCDNGRHECDEADCDAGCANIECTCDGEET